ncbi:MAG: hypothetical protein WC829_18180 [Hyphomicrobium sp.]|jgi:hypothetical protein
MNDTRHKNGNWNLGAANSEGRVTFDQITVAVLMDIRDELQKLNRLLHCPDFMAIPSKLDAIHKKIPARKRRSRSAQHAKTTPEVTR